MTASPNTECYVPEDPPPSPVAHGTLDLATHATRKIEQYDSGTDIYNGGTVQ